MVQALVVVVRVTSTFPLTVTQLLKVALPSMAAVTPERENFSRVRRIPLRNESKFSISQLNSPSQSHGIATTKSPPIPIEESHLGTGLEIPEAVDPLEHVIEPLPVNKA
jgi:hypothetical protein